MFLGRRMQVENVPGMSGMTKPGVPQQVFLGVLWSGVASSGLFLGARLYSRLRGQRRLFADDWLAILAFMLIGTTGGLWQWASKDMYHILNVQSGDEHLAADFFDRVTRWLMVSLIVELFFYTSLFVIKLSFMLFFRRLDANVDFLKRLWWPSMLFTLATYCISIGNVDYRCLLGSTEVVITYCNTAESIYFTGVTLKLNCALDVFSDFLIMLMPIILLWNVRICRAKKIAFVGLFSLSIITIAIATARTADIDVTHRPDGQIDPTYLWLWSAIEPTVGLIISSLSAFPSLFRSSKRLQNKPAFSPTESHLRMMSRIRRSRNSKRTGTSDTTLMDLSISSGSGGLSRLDSQHEYNEGKFVAQHPLAEPWRSTEHDLTNRGTLPV